MSSTPGEGPGEGRTGGAPSHPETRAVAVPCPPLRRSLAVLAALAVLAGPRFALAQEAAPRPAPDAPAAEPPPASEPQPPPAPEQAPSSPPEATPPESPPPPDELLVPPVPPPAVPVPDPAPPRPEDVFSGRPPKGEDDDGPADEERSWFDSGHEAVGRVFFAPAIRIDRFFSDETDLDPERAESFARLRTGVLLREDGKPRYTVDVLADIKLPGVNRWLDRTRLVLTGASDPETYPVDGTATSTAAQERGTPNLELRFGAYRGIRASVDLGAGVLVRLPVGAFARARYRMAVPIEDRLLGRFSTQAFWRTDLHLGTRVTAGLEWPATSSSLVSLGATAQVAQRKTRGVEYGADLGYSYAFTRRSAIALGADARGASELPVAVGKYRLYTRFRQDVMRHWLFVDVEPEIGWPWTPDRGRYRAYAVTFRLEVQFEGDRAVDDTR